MQDLRLEKMRAVGKLTGLCLKELSTQIHPGMSTKDIESLVIYFQNKYNLKNSQYGYRDFPGYCCTSVNDVICHGIPSKKDILKDGDIIKVDVTFNLDGFHGDACETYLVGNCSLEVQNFVSTARTAMWRGIHNCYSEEKISIIGKKIQEYVEENGYGVVRDYTGHHIGEEMHMLPQIPHTYDPLFDHIPFKKNEFCTIEPMITIGSPNYYLSQDGWAVKTRDGSWSAQFERTIAILENNIEILT